MTPTSSFCIHLKKREECDNPVCNPKAKAAEAKHTQGPWKAMKRSNQLGARTIYVVSPAKGNKPVHVTSGAITPETEANANLIAAAPELLEALIECRKCINHHGIIGDFASAMADAAIDKARGN